MPWLLGLCSVAVVWIARATSTGHPAILWYSVEGNAGLVDLDGPRRVAYTWLHMQPYNVDKLRVYLLLMQARLSAGIFVSSFQEK